MFLRSTAGHMAMKRTKIDKAQRQADRLEQKISRQPAQPRKKKPAREDLKQAAVEDKGPLAGPSLDHASGLRSAEIRPANSIRPCGRERLIAPQVEDRALPTLRDEVNLLTQRRCQTASSQATGRY